MTKRRLIQSLLAIGSLDDEVKIITEDMDAEVDSALEITSVDNTFDDEICMITCDG